MIEFLSLVGFAMRIIFAMLPISYNLESCKIVQGETQPDNLEDVLLDE